MNNHATAVLHARNLCVLALLTAVFLAFGWVGYIASDDIAYASAGQGWLSEPGYVGENHWALRHPLVLAVAGSFATLGVTEVALVLPTVGYFLLVAALTYWVIARWFGSAEALLAGVLLVTTPLFAVGATVPSVDVVELFYVLISFACFVTSLTATRPAGWLIATGLAAGVAFLARETALALLAFYFILFLIGYGHARRDYLVYMGIGFVAVVGLDMAYFFAANGDPLHRIRTDLLTHARIDMDTWTRVEAKAAGGVGSGNVQVHWLVDPFLAILVNQEFGLLFYVAFVAGVWAAWRGGEHGPAGRVGRLIAGLALCWFVAISYLMPLRELPRYYAVAAWAGAVLVAVWWIRGLAPRSRILVAIPLLAVLGVNVLGVYVDNRDPLFGERALVRYLAEHDGVIYTDPSTSENARFLLREAGIAVDRVADDPPPAGVRFLHNPPTAQKGFRGPRAYEPADYTPAGEWPVVWRADPGRKLSGHVLELIGLDRLMPASIYRKLNQPNPPVSVHDVPVAQATTDPAE